MKNKRLALLMTVILAGATALSACGSTDSAVSVNEAATENADTEQNADATTDNSLNSDAESADGDTSETAERPTEDVFIEKVENLSDDFILGMDASSVLVEENSGVKYYNFDGEESDVFEVLADAGINYIRLRVWNDPYDADGNGYGGGNNDVPTAITLGKRATEYGMKVCIDFHYSDFWADPKRQHAPKAWEDMSVDEKCTALSEFTEDSLSQMLDAGVDIGMVQVGNEINYGMSGEANLRDVLKLLDSGCSAVREAAAASDRDIKVAIHYTNIESKGEVDGLVHNLVEAGIDFDAIGLSYYPFWDGSFDNMQSMVSAIQKRYDKEVFIAETSYCYTSEDGDGTANSLSGTDDLVEGYPATVQGQAHMVRDVIANAGEAGAIGVFYWEGTWIPVGSDPLTNSVKWEKYGSGWASSYAAEYDPDDAGLYYGGCSWDNQALFDFDGYPLASLKVFDYLKTGNETELRIDAVPDIFLTLGVGDAVELPEKIGVIYNDPSANDEVIVDWDKESLAKVDTSKEAEYDVPGVVSISGGDSLLSDAKEPGESATNDAEAAVVNCHIEVKLENFVQNPSFEDNNISMWEVEYSGSSNPTDIQEKQDDAHTGDFAFHFWSGTEDMSFTLKQTVTGLEDGVYQLECYAQGGDVDENAAFTLSCVASTDKEAQLYEQNFELKGWANWQNPVIKDIKVTQGYVEITLTADTNVNSWGTFDDFVLKKVAD